MVKNCASASCRKLSVSAFPGAMREKIHELLLYSLNHLPNIAANNCAYVTSLNIFIESES
jgi:hypothetical protein